MWPPSPIEDNWFNWFQQGTVFTCSKMCFSSLNGEHKSFPYTLLILLHRHSVIYLMYKGLKHTHTHTHTGLTRLSHREQLRILCLAHPVHQNTLRTNWSKKFLNQQPSSHQVKALWTELLLPQNYSFTGSEHTNGNTWQLLWLSHIQRGIMATFDLQKFIWGIHYFMARICATSQFICLSVSKQMSATSQNIWCLTLQIQLTFVMCLLLCVSAEVVCLDRGLLFFYQLCKLQKLGGH